MRARVGGHPSECAGAEFVSVVLASQPAGRPSCRVSVAGVTEECGRAVLNDTYSIWLWLV